MFEFHERVYSKESDEVFEDFVYKFKSRAQLLKWFKNQWQSSFVPCSTEFLYDMNRRREVIIQFQGEKRRLHIVEVSDGQ